MTITITQQWVDMAGKYRLMVDLRDDGNTTMLKFDEAPTNAEIKAVAERLIAQQDLDAANLALDAEQAALEADLLAAVAGGL